MLKRKSTTRFTAEQYLALEEHSETKHEFYDGKIYDMAGGLEEYVLVESERAHDEVFHRLGAWRVDH